MNKSRIYLWGIGISFVLVMILNSTTPDEISWNESYSKYKKTPYGAYATFELLQDLFPDNEIEVSHRTIYEMQYDYYDQANIILIDNYLYLEENDSEALLSMVRNGHNVFVAANYFNGPISDQLGFNTDYDWQFNVGDSARKSQLVFESGQLSDLDSLTITRSSVDHYFSTYDTAHARVLARNDRGDAILVQMEYGEGMFFFCTTPLAFTNYHMLNGEHRFAEAALSHLPNVYTIWDEYNKVGRIGNRSPWRFILSERTLRSGLYIILVVALVFLVFNSKREQRPIPVLEPLKNSTREFIRTVGRLYMQKGDHVDLARKMSMYLKDEIRKNCYATHIHDDEELIERMSERFGLPLEKVTALFARMRYMENVQNISQEELLEFSEIVERNKKILRYGKG